jgi:hypothetical protein
MGSSCCLCILPSAFECLNQSLWNLVCISWNLSQSQWLTHKSPLSICVPVFIFPTVAKQRHGKNVRAATNTHVTIEELLDASFSVRSVSYQRKVDISSSQNFLLVYFPYFFNSFYMSFILWSIQVYLAFIS